MTSNANLKMQKATGAELMKRISPNRRTGRFAFFFFILYSLQFTRRRIIFKDPKTEVETAAR